MLDTTIKTALSGIVHNNNTAAVNAAFHGGKGMMAMRFLSGRLFVWPLLAVFMLGAAHTAHAQATVSGNTAPTQAATTASGATSSTAPANTGVTRGDAIQSQQGGVQTLPPVADAPPVDMPDPLAEFRRAQAAANPPATTNAAPLPTPGGFQQPVNGAVMDQNYNLDLTKDIEEKQAELQQKAREQAFDSALNGLMPMTPDQIRALLDKYKVTREASESRIGGSPKPEIVVQTVSLDPGVTPPTIKLSPGHVTSVTMMDITGMPWPVQDVSWGGNFEVISPGEGGHLIRISPMAATEVGNMSVQLVGLKTPVTFTLETQLDVVQYRFDARIPEYGPNAAPPLIDPGTTTITAGSEVLTQILDGTPPAGTEKLKVDGADGRTSVFRIGDAVYLRTSLSLLSPGWSASVKSGDGMTVYVVNNSPVFLLSDRGKLVRAVVESNKVMH